MADRDSTMEDMGEQIMMKNFYQGKKVLVTGHTGFKGTWLSRMLTLLGARVYGFALVPPTKPSLYEAIGADSWMQSYIGDIRDLSVLKRVFDEIQPEIVFHLAAQPIVRDSYQDPVYTYETNVMGTIHVLECIRLNHCVKSFVNITTDKVYENKEWEYGYRENDPLDGYDPYSNSKSCSELVTHSYQKSFFADQRCAISTSRAGNVIGGGDFANDRIIPDCVRAAIGQKAIFVRNPNSIRPYQHVLEPLNVYITVAMKQYQNAKYAGYYNVGPDDRDCITTGALTDIFCSCWGEELKWETGENQGPHEANLLKLDCSRIKTVFQWKPVYSIHQAIEKTVKWSKAYRDQQDMLMVTDDQINDFLNNGKFPSQGWRTEAEERNNV